MGVKFVVPEKVSDVTYSIDSKWPDGLLLTTPRLAELAQTVSWCGSADRSAGISRAKVGDDHFGSPWSEKELSDIGVKLGEYYYYPDGQQACMGTEEDLAPIQSAVNEVGAIRASLEQIAKTVQPN